MGIFDAILDLTLGEEAGSMYRIKKAVKDAERAEYEQQLIEERRHQELLNAIKGSRNDDDDY